MPDEVHPADRSSTWGLLDIQVDGNAFEETLKKPGGKHFRLRKFFPDFTSRQSHTQRLVTQSDRFRGRYNEILLQHLLRRAIRCPPEELWMRDSIY